MLKSTWSLFHIKRTCHTSTNQTSYVLDKMKGVKVALWVNTKSLSMAMTIKGYRITIVTCTGANVINKFYSSVAIFDAIKKF